MVVKGMLEIFVFIVGPVCIAFIAIILYKKEIGDESEVEDDGDDDEVML